MACHCARAELLAELPIDSTNYPAWISSDWKVDTHEAVVDAHENLCIFIFHQALLFIQNKLVKGF
jgi:hypothetical protein